MALEAVLRRENVVNHALHSAMMGSRATVYISRFLQASLGPDSLCVLQSDLSVQTNIEALILSDTVRAFVCKCTGFSAAQLENEALSLSIDCSGLAGDLEHISLTTVRRLPSDTTDIVLNSPLSMHLVDALMARYVPQGVDCMLLAQFANILVEFVVFGHSSVCALLQKHVGCTGQNTLTMPVLTPCFNQASVWRTVHSWPFCARAICLQPSFL